MIDEKNRRSPRLQGFDYSQPGFYFITICTHQHQHFLGKICDGDMQLSTMGKIVGEQWKALEECYPHIVLDEFVAMPNHVHGIIQVQDTRERPDYTNVPDPFRGRLEAMADQRYVEVEPGFV